MENETDGRPVTEEYNGRDVYICRHCGHRSHPADPPLFGTDAAGIGVVLCQVCGLPVGKMRDFTRLTAGITPAA